MLHSQRPARLFAAFVLTFLVYLSSRHLGHSPSQIDYPSDLSNFNDHEKLPTDTEDYSKPHAGSSVADIAVQPALTKEPLLVEESKLVEDAHTLPTADSFRRHFKAVIELPGLIGDEARSGCQWPALHEVNFQFHESQQDWVKHDPSDTEIGMRRKEWQEFISTSLLPYENYKDRFDGRGIVIVAGNQKSMQRVKVVLGALKKLGSRMPVEIQYWGDEMTDDSRREMSEIWSEMYFNDLASPTNILKTNHDGPFINYQLKSAAIVNSRFAEPLLLDSDNIPVVDPVVLYESSIYKEYGTLFWPDIARTRPNNPIWGITNTKCRINEYEQESGQLIVDKRRFFYHLQLAAWFNNEKADYYNKYLLGDKDMFRFAWHALKTKFGAPPKWLTSVGTISDDGFYCGHSFAQYSPDGEVAFLHGGLIKTMAKQVMKWQRDTRGGIFQVYKKSEYDDQHFVNVNVSIKVDMAEYLPNRPVDLDVAMCTDLHQVIARPLDELVPGFEETFREIGGYWMLEE
ncbi:hypothetical protein MMC10_005838 [Thelotrema lepadinum]|nr:hypothetical protein [Thelotrema lepadinum]